MHWLKIFDFYVFNVVKVQNGQASNISKDDVIKILTNLEDYDKSNKLQKESIEVISSNINDNFSTKEEAAQFLAQLIHETVGLKYVEEIDKSFDYNSEKINSCCFSNCMRKSVSYHGRGFIQLSWDYNYKEASYDLYSNNFLVKNPDVICSDLQLAYDVSQWYWDKKVKSVFDKNHFGYATRAINGALECENKQNHRIAKKRYRIYLEVARVLKIKNVADEKGCY